MFFIEINIFLSYLINSYIFFGNGRDCKLGNDILFYIFRMDNLTVHRIFLNR